MANIMNCTPDVEVVFHFNGKKKHKIKSGYRPDHKIRDDYLTTGIHCYENEYADPDGDIKGTITFLDPSSYPHSLWKGKRIIIQEGEHIVGYAEVIRILNKTLKA